MAVQDRPRQLDPRRAPDRDFAVNLVAAEGGFEAMTGKTTTRVFGDTTGFSLDGEGWSDARIWEVLRVYAMVRSHHHTAALYATASNLEALLRFPTQEVPHKLPAPEVPEVRGEAGDGCHYLDLPYFLFPARITLAGSWSQENLRAVAKIARLAVEDGYERGRAEFGGKVRQVIGAAPIA